MAGWRGVYGEEALESGAQSASDDDEGGPQQLPKLERGEAVDTREVAAEEKVTKPPRRYSDASLLAAMETAGKLVDDDELREAMKDSGIGTPGHARGDHRAPDRRRLRRARRPLAGGHGEGPQRDPAARRAPAHLAVADRRLGARGWARSSTARSRARSSCATSRCSPARPCTTLDEKLKDVRIPRANLGPCPVCGHDIVENRKGFSCWSREDPGCGFVIWKSKAGKTLPAAVARELISTGRTEQPGRRASRAARAAPSAPGWR